MVDGAGRADAGMRLGAPKGSLAGMAATLVAGCCCIMLLSGGPPMVLVEAEGDDVDDSIIEPRPERSRLTNLLGMPNWSVTAAAAEEEEGTGTGTGAGAYAGTKVATGMAGGAEPGAKLSKTENEELSA